MTVEVVQLAVVAAFASFPSSCSCGWSVVMVERWRFFRTAGSVGPGTQVGQLAIGRIGDMSEGSLKRNRSTTFNIGIINNTVLYCHWH